MDTLKELPFESVVFEEPTSRPRVAGANTLPGDAEASLDGRDILTDHDDSP